MLLGVPLRPQLPPLPQKGTDAEGLRRYLEQLDQAVFVYISGVITGGVGMLGVRGLSSSGTIAQNFVLGATGIAGASLYMVSFARTEPDNQYRLWIQSTAPASTVLTGWTQATTNVVFSFASPPPSGASLNILLLR